MADTSNSAPIELEIAAQYQGWPVVVKFAGRLDQLAAVVKRLEAAGLTPAQASAAGGTHAAPSAQRRRVERVEPFYNADGVPCCPKHRKPLKQGQFGYYCSVKDEAGTNGFCSLRFVSQ